MKVADALIPDGPAGTRPSRQPAFLDRLDRALAARRDAYGLITELADRLCDLPDERLPFELRRLASEPKSGFDELSTVIAGAYLMIDDVRDSLGYSGQTARPPRFDEAAEEIMNGILEPVLRRGPVYREVPGPGDS